MDIAFIEIIQSVILIIIAIVTVILSIGILRLDSKMDNVVYARIHILGAIDIMAVISLIVLDYPLLGILYFILAPFTAHAISHGFFYGEDNKNNNSLNREEIETDECPSTDLNIIKETGESE